MANNVTFKDGSQRTVSIGRKASLRGADLVASGLTNLRGVDLSGADLRETNLNGVDLRGANLNDALYYSADLKGAILS